MPANPQHPSYPVIYARGLAATCELPGGDGIAFHLDVVQTSQPGISAVLRIEARPWNEEAR